MIFFVCFCFQTFFLTSKKKHFFFSELSFLSLQRVFLFRSSLSAFRSFLSSFSACSFLLSISLCLFLFFPLCSAFRLSLFFIFSFFLFLFSLFSSLFSLFAYFSSSRCVSIFLLPFLSPFTTTAKKNQHTRLLQCYTKSCSAGTDQIRSVHRETEPREPPERSQLRRERTERAHGDGELAQVAEVGDPRRGDDHCPVILEPERPQLLGADDRLREAREARELSPPWRENCVRKKKKKKKERKFFFLLKTKQSSFFFTNRINNNKNHRSRNDASPKPSNTPPPRSPPPLPAPSMPAPLLLASFFSSPFAAPLLLLTPTAKK